jgi:hypothetical protein
MPRPSNADQLPPGYKSVRQSGQTVGEHSRGVSQGTKSELQLLEHPTSLCLSTRISLGTRTVLTSERAPVNPAAWQKLHKQRLSEQLDQGRHVFPFS